MFEIIISLIAISVIIILHELGHYLTAKKFDVKVEEFGLGLPPRLYGKKIGETIWSLNWIPFGGFVRMYGEEADAKTSKKEKDSHRSFGAKPIWQRMLITIAGCLMFWIVAFVIFVFVFTVGTYVVIDDYKDDPNAIVQITEIKEDSPAQLTELQAGDLIKEVCVKKECIQINQIRGIQTIFRENAGEEVIIKIRRGDKELSKKIVLDEDVPKIGIGLIRIGEQSFPFLEAVPMAGERTVNVTILIAEGLYGAVSNLMVGEDPGELAGPVRIVGIMGDRLELGITHFLSLLALLTINLAILNLLPIPGLDGGRLVFLAYEGIVKKPFPQKIEGYLTIFFLLSLMGLMLIVTISEIHAIL